MCFVDTRPVKKCCNVDRLPCRQGNRLSMTFCRPARDALLSNQETEKLNFDMSISTHSC